MYRCGRLGWVSLNSFVRLVFCTTLTIVQLFLLHKEVTALRVNRSACGVSIRTGILRDRHRSLANRPKNHF